MDAFKDADFLTDFIQKWKEHPVLWQTKSTINKNKDAREKARQSMLVFVKTRVPNATTATVKNKINSIRGTYRAQRVQVLASMRSGAAADSIYKPTLWYYSQLQFLDDHIETRPSLSTLPPRGSSQLPSSQSSSLPCRQEQTSSEEEEEFLEDPNCEPWRMVCVFCLNLVSI